MSKTSVTCSLQTWTSNHDSLLKRTPFSHLINGFPIQCFKKQQTQHRHQHCTHTHTPIHVHPHTHTHLLAAEILTDPLWQTGREIRVRWVMEREAKEKRDGGMRNTRQIRDRIQVFGFARQLFSRLHSPQHPACIRLLRRHWPPVSRSLPESFYWELKNVKLKRGRRKKCLTKRGENKWSSWRTSLPLLLTFGWTLRWVPPTWLIFCKVRQRERE